MGFFDFFKRDSTPEIEKYGNLVKDYFDDFLMEKSFLFKKQEVLASNILELYYLAQGKDDRYIVITLYDSYTLAMISGEGNSGYTHFWDLEINLGKGNYDYPEQKWSSVPLKSFYSSDLKHGFNKKEEIKLTLDRLKKDFDELGKLFLNNELDGFYELRRERALSEPVTQFVSFDKKTGLQSVEVNQVELKLKEKYGRPY